MLSQGCQIDEEKSGSIRGEKFFRPHPDEATRLSITLVCLPWAIDKDTLVKVGEETVISHDFYRRLFALIKALDT